VGILLSVLMLDNMLMVVADNFLLLVLVLALALRTVLDKLLEILATVSCPEISENKNKEWVCDETISMTVYG